MKAGLLGILASVSLTACLLVSSHQASAEHEPAESPITPYTETVRLYYVETVGGEDFWATKMVQAPSLPGRTAQACFQAKVDRAVRCFYTSRSDKGVEEVELLLIVLPGQETI